METWEACKENILPIKRGRSVKGLNETLDKPFPKNGEFSVEKMQENIFVNTLKLKVPEEKTELEMLDAYINYIKWTRDTYPTNSDKSLKLLEVSTLINMKFS